MNEWIHTTDLREVQFSHVNFVIFLTLAITFITKGRILGEMKERRLRDIKELAPRRVVNQGPRGGMHTRICKFRAGLASLIQLFFPYLFSLKNERDGGK